MIAINIVTYLLVAGVFFWGIKFSGKSFNDNLMSVESTKTVRGLAAMLILFHHISQQSAFENARQIQAFNKIGIFLVAIFFFCSGYGLIKQFDSKPDYLNGFVKKRILKSLALPFYVNVIVYAIFYLAVGVKFKTAQWITNLLGLTLINEYAWFPIVLALLYLSFYFIFRFIKNQKIVLALMLAIIIFQGIFFCFWGHFAWWSNPKKNWWLDWSILSKAPWWTGQKLLWFSGEWWVNSSIGFFVGMIFARNEKSIIQWFKKNYWLKLISSIILFSIFQTASLSCQNKFGYWSEYAGKGPMIGDKLICYFSQLPQIIFFLVMIFLIRMKIKIANPITKFFAKYSLHTYLMNLLPITVFSFLLYKWDRPFYKPLNWNLGLYIVAVVSSSILLGVAEEKLCALIGRLGNKIGNKKSPQ